MTDPVFSTRAELVAWASKVSKRTQWNIQMAPDVSAKKAAMQNGLDRIRRVTLAHSHLED